MYEFRNTENPTIVKPHTTLDQGGGLHAQTKMYAMHNVRYWRGKTSFKKPLVR